MSQLTTQQITQLARQFFAMAKTITEYRECHWESLSTEQHQRLSKMQCSICNYADDLLVLSAILPFEEVEETLNQVEQVTKKVNWNIQHEQEVNRVIDIAARVVVLGGAVVSQSPLAVVSTLADLAAHLQ